jgi:hypothetical protein
MQLVLKAYGQAFLEGGGNVTVTIVLTYARHSRSGLLINRYLTTDPLAGQVTTLGYIDVAHPSPS